jgi:hypothetical protein
MWVRIYFWRASSRIYELKLSRVSRLNVRVPRTRATLMLSIKMWFVFSVFKS